ncbi:MAG: D-alanine--D-alanine ligase [Gammaproteobacteria bacterium]|nr:D-alanine--D-alanine ligase [Pseudomonadales bacterium]MCP5345566.1 D-alanine--D-alanine ligase [Pseudomonadales bacterium]
METEEKAELIRKAGRVAVLMGGTSAEREISLLSGKQVMSALTAAGLDAVAIDAASDLVSQLHEVQPTRVFNILHGRGGEDGVVQGLLRSLAIPFTGSDVLASALAMDKLRSKLIWRQLGLSTPDYLLLDDRSDWDGIIRKFGAVVVKPVNEGSSIGMSIASDPGQLREAYQTARQYDRIILGEQYIRGDEYTVAILQQIALPAIQLKTDHEFYDFDAKYVANDTQYLCPVDLVPEDLGKLNELALGAFNALGCEAWGRVDLMRDQQGRFYLLEVNTVPGMTDHSLVPMAARQAGISFEDLLLQILFAKGIEEG